MKPTSILAIGMMLCVSSSVVQADAAQTQAHSTPTSRDDNARYGWADVLRVDPVYEDAPASGDQAATPPQPCYEEQVPVRTPPAQAEDDSGKRVVGGVLGAIVGGILGHQVGKGDGRKVATVGGAAAGAVVGSKLASDSDNGRQDSPAQKYTIVRHCPGGEQGTRRIAAYDVEYRYRGDVYTSRLNYDPGDRIRVKVNVTPAD
jgi:uncharacterized protein YcfJ